MRRPASITILLLALLAAGCSPIGGVSGQTSLPIVEATPTSIPTTTTSTIATATSKDAVLVIGDWGAATDAESEVASAMDAYAADHPVAAILTTGDNLYDDEGDPALAPFDWVAASGIDWWVAWGNHDTESSVRIAEVNRLFSAPPRWTTVEWGAVSIVILDSNQMESEEQKAFLDAEMKRIDGPTVVVFHHPPLNCSVHDDNEAFWDEWRPLFDDDVVLVLSGHAHNYQRFEDEGIQYVVAGAGGKSIYELDDCPSGHVPRLVGSEAHSYLALTQGIDGLTLTAITRDDEIVDEFTIPLTTDG
ncbi:MAG: metallophosphoesterase [Acidimicrobiia bacterium]